MRVIVAKDNIEGSKIAYDILWGAIESGAETLGLATGGTPEGLYALMVADDKDYSKLMSINLDEYVGLSHEDENSYHYYMNDKLFSNKAFKETHVPDGTKNEEDATAEYNQLLVDHPIDFQLLGIGHNGHIAFNEPGTSFETRTHKVSLTEDTIQANKRYFDNEEDVPRYAYTMGIQSIMDAKEILLMAFGDSKAETMKMTIEGPITEEVPASILQNHPNITFVLDEASASLLTETKINQK